MILTAFTYTSRLLWPVVGRSASLPAKALEIIYTLTINPEVRDVITFLADSRSKTHRFKTSTKIGNSQSYTADRKIHRHHRHYECESLIKSSLFCFGVRPRPGRVAEAGRGGRARRFGTRHRSALLALLRFPSALFAFTQLTSFVVLRKYSEPYLSVLILSDIVSR